MTDRILGYPSNLTTISNNGAGFVRVTFAPWELDWEWFDLIAVDGSNYLANTTTGVAVAITAKGGAENLGYWFDINQAFPSANWVTGNRITPQRQVGINQYATIAAAVAALVNNDTLLVWYQSTANRRNWAGVSASFSGKGGSVWGMLSRRQIDINFNGICVGYAGNLLGQNIQARVTNLWFINSNSGGGVSYAPGVGGAGAGVRVSRCLMQNAYFGVSTNVNAAADSVWVDNCIMISCYQATNSGANQIPHRTSFCTAFRLGMFGGSPVVANNCLSVEGVFSGVNWTNCVEDGLTLPVVPTNLSNQDVRSQIKLFFDGASPGRKKFPLGLRVLGDSVCVGRGLAVVGLERDADGRLRANPPTVGAFEAYPTAYVPGAEIIRPANPLSAVRG
jgi:hypothetical protein